MFIIRKLTTTFLRHLLPIGVTTLAPVSIYLLFGLWWFTVLAISGDPATDETFVLSDFLKDLLLVWVVYPFLFSAMFSGLFLFPPALLLEWFASKFRILVIAIPAVFILIPAGCLVLALWLYEFRGHFQTLDTFVDLMAALSFIALAYSIPWSIYWSFLWFGRAIVHSLRVGIKILIYALFGGKGKSDLATHSSM